MHLVMKVYYIILSTYTCYLLLTSTRYLLLTFAMAKTVYPSNTNKNTGIWVLILNKLL